MEPTVLIIVEWFLKVAVVPLGLWLISLNTKISVLETKLRGDKDSHTREMAELKEIYRNILGKLDSIEVFLRK